MLDADVMVRPLRHQLVLDLDRREAGRLAHLDGAAYVHGIAPAAGTVEDQRQRACHPDLEPRLAHLGQAEIGLGPAFDVPHGAAAEVQHLESCCRG